MSDGMGREPAYLSSHATNRYFIPNWGKFTKHCKNGGGLPLNKLNEAFFLGFHPLLEAFACHDGIIHPPFGGERAPGSEIIF